MSKNKERQEMLDDIAIIRQQAFDIMRERRGQYADKKSHRVGGLLRFIMSEEDKKPESDFDYEVYHIINMITLKLCRYMSAKDKGIRNVTKDTLLDLINYTLMLAELEEVEHQLFTERESEA